MKYTIVLEESGEGFAVPGLPGCHSQGDTEAEALANHDATFRLQRHRREQEFVGWLKE